MKSPEYYVQQADLEIEPNLEDVDFGGASLDFEVDDSPIYDEEVGVLKFEAQLELSLQSYPLFRQGTENEEEEEVGEINLDILIVIHGENDEFAEFIEIWETDGYRSVDWEFRYYVEAGIITEVFSPLANLVDNTFRGVLPGISFSEPPQPESEGLPIDRNEFLKEYIEENVKATIINYIRNNTGEEFEDSEITISLDEEWTTLDTDYPENVEKIIDEHEVELGNLVAETIRQIVEEEADESIGSVRATFESYPEEDDE